MKNRTMGLISRTADGLYRLPAFIDAHVHVESSHLTPAQFGRLVASRIEALKAAARQTGSTLADPFATLSFLALPVIPALKLTDCGLFAL